ncbi:thermonuclease family protein [Nitratireductor sp. GCM10026969]|uniref:thermonuclease family protein n=1 Tax=Nitratireductor sp. GCM10026969 TaxID=3252645 RepID=UPI003606BE01
MIELVSTAVLTCLSLSAVDGDTIKCDGENMRIMGPGAPNQSAVDTPEIYSPECQQEKFLGEQARRRLEELLRQDVKVEDSGVRDRWERPLVWVRLPNWGDRRGGLAQGRIRGGLATGESDLMVRATDGAELRELINESRPIDNTRYRRFLLSATSRISDVDLFELRLAALELAEFIGTDGKLEAEQIAELLDEIDH